MFRILLVKKTRFLFSETIGCTWNLYRPGFEIYKVHNFACTAPSKVIYKSRNNIELLIEVSF